jgi:hypothetical protein
VIGVIGGLIYLFENLLGIPVPHIPIGCDFVIGKLWKGTPFRHVAETLLIKLHWVSWFVPCTSLVGLSYRTGLLRTVLLELRLEVILVLRYVLNDLSHLDHIYQASGKPAAKTTHGQDIAACPQRKIYSLTHGLHHG